MQKNFDTPHPTALYVEIGSGDLRVHAVDVVETTVEVTGKDAEDAVVEARGDQIVVLGPRGRGFLGGNSSLSVVVTMPTGSKLATKLGSADLVVSGRLGETRLRSGSGDMRLETVDAEVLAESGSGDLTIDEVTGDLRAKTGSGDVVVDVLGGAASISTGSGDVTIGTAGGDVEVKTGSGDLRVREAQEDLSLTTASGDLLIDLMGAGQLQARNVSGDIRVGVPQGLPVWTDVNTLSGSVRSNLEGAGQPGEGQDYLELRASTVSGDIQLEQR